KRTRRVMTALLVLLVSAGLLFVPEPTPDAPVPAEARPFAWNQDEVWASLKSRFDAARGRCPSLDRVLPIRLHAIGQSIETLRLLRGTELPADDPAWPALETSFFEAAADVAACPGAAEGEGPPTHAAELLELQARLRGLIETARVGWDP